MTAAWKECSDGMRKVVNGQTVAVVHARHAFGGSSSRPVEWIAVRVVDGREAGLLGRTTTRIAAMDLADEQLGGGR